MEKSIDRVVGENVWVVYDNMLKEGTIHKIEYRKSHFYFNDCVHESVLYYVVLNTLVGLRTITFKGDELFDTKEELKKSLL